MTPGIGPEQMTHRCAVRHKVWQRRHLGSGLSNQTARRRFLHLVLSIVQEMLLVVKRTFDLLNAEKVRKGLHFHENAS